MNSFIIFFHPIGTYFFSLKNFSLKNFYRKFRPVVQIFFFSFSTFPSLSPYRVNKLAPVSGRRLIRHTAQITFFIIKSHPSGHTISSILVKIFTNINSKYFYYDKLVASEQKFIIPLLTGTKQCQRLQAMEYRIRIRNLREDHDKTQQEIAEYLGTSQTMYARYERGANEMPIRHLIRLAQYYNVDMNYICGLSSLKKSFPDK